MSFTLWTGTADLSGASLGTGRRADIEQASSKNNATSRHVGQLQKCPFPIRGLGTDAQACIVRFVFLWKKRVGTSFLGVLRHYS